MGADRWNGYELYHHGIQGQKWGEQNGPPYPLDKQTHKAVIKNAKQSAKQLNKLEKDRVGAAANALYAHRKVEKLTSAKKINEKKVAEWTAKGEKYWNQAGEINAQKETLIKELKQNGYTVTNKYVERRVVPSETYASQFIKNILLLPLGISSVDYVKTDSDKYKVSST